MALSDITTRFLDTMSWLIKERKAHDKKDIATNLGVSTSLMTEISKGRSNVGVLLLQNIVIKYGVSADWLLTGEGSMLKDDTTPVPSDETPSDPSNAALNTLKGIIKEQALEIARLELEVENLKKCLETAN